MAAIQSIIHDIHTASNGTATVLSLSPGFSIYQTFLRNHHKNYEDIPELQESDLPYYLESSIEEAFLSLEGLANCNSLDGSSEDYMVLGRCTTVKTLRVLKVDRYSTLSKIRQKYGVDVLKDELGLDGEIYMGETEDECYGFITLYDSSAVHIELIDRPTVVEIQQIMSLSMNSLLEINTQILNTSTMDSKSVLEL